MASFGFSIGDIITCTQLALKTYHSLRTAPREFASLRIEVLSLSTALQALSDEVRSPTSSLLLHGGGSVVSPQRREDLRQLLQSCAQGMEELRALVLSYGSLGGRGRRRVGEWLEFAARDKVGPREKIAVHTASVNMFLGTLSHASLGRVEFLLRNSRGSVGGGAGGGGAVDGEKPRDRDFGVRGGGGGGGGGGDGSDGGQLWAGIGQDLAREGIKESDVRAFEEDLKAYVRYLVRGETPFWRDLEAAETQAAAAVENEKVKMQRMREREDRRSGSAASGAPSSSSTKAQQQELSRAIKAERALLEKQKGLVEYYRKEMRKQEEGRRRENLAREVEDARRREKEHMERVESLMAQLRALSSARRSSDLQPVVEIDVAMSRRASRQSGNTEEEVEEEERRLRRKLEEERLRARTMEMEQRLRRENETSGSSGYAARPGMPGAGVSDEDDKASLMIKRFEGLFDLDQSPLLDDLVDEEPFPSPTSSFTAPVSPDPPLPDQTYRSSRAAPPPPPPPQPPPLQRTSSKGYNDPPPKSATEVRTRLAYWIQRRDEMKAKGDQGRVHDLEARVIPETVGLLRAFGVGFPDAMAWRWHRCDRCGLPIADVRFHCYLCRDDNWDVCRACWDKGVTCLDESHPRLLEIDLVQSGR